MVISFAIWVYGRSQIVQRFSADVIWRRPSAMTKSGREAATQT